MKKALIIGNQNYNNLESLALPHNDANKMEQILKTIGFKTLCYHDLSYTEMKSNINLFTSEIDDGDEIIFYFSGHGYSFEGHNYITPIDSLSSIDVSYHKAVFDGFDKAALVIDLQFLLDGLKNNISGNNIILIDACRTVYGRQMFGDKRIGELVEVPLRSGNFYISYATTLNLSAYENKDEENSVYMNAFAKTIFRKGQTIDELFDCITSFIVNNNQYQKPCISKSTTQSLMLIDDTNYCFQIESYYFKELFELYECIRDEICSNSQFNFKNNIDYNVDLIYTNLKGLVYYPNRMLKKIIRKSIVAIRDNLGIVGILLEDDLFIRIDVTPERLFIEGNYGKRYPYNNDNYYDYENFRKFVVKCNKKSTFAYNYKGKTILSVFDRYQIINSSKWSLSHLIEVPISRIAENNNSSEILKLITSYIDEYKNIVIVGTPFCSKEEMITACTEYFSSFDKVFEIQEDKKITILNGNTSQNPINFDLISSLNSSEITSIIESIYEEGANRLIYQNKSFRGDCEELFSRLDTLHIPKLVSCDYDPGIFETLIDNIKPIFDLIIIMEEIVDVGSIVSKVYTLKNGKYMCDIENRIDYSKLEEFRSLLI